MNPNADFELSSSSHPRGGQDRPRSDVGDDARRERGREQIIILRGDGSVSYVSEGLMDLTGIDPGAQARPLIDDALQFGQKSFWDLILERFSSYRFIDGVQATLLTRAGPLTVTVDASVAPLNNDDGLAIILRLRDLGAVSSAINEALDADEELLRLANVGRTARTLVHEILNPLSVIKGSLDLLRKRFEDGVLTDPKATEEAHARMRRATDHIVHVVRGVSGAAGARGGALRSACVDDVGDTLTDWYAVDLAAQGIELRVRRRSSGQSPITVACPSHILVQILTNLIMNARDALQCSPDGSPRVIDIQTRRVGSFAEISVTDSALPPGSDAVKRQGFGIGLRLCRQLLDAYGGSLVWESDRRPTCLVVVLPLANE